MSDYQHADPLAPVLHPEARERGRRLLRKLIAEIQSVWRATVETPVALHRHGPDVDVEHFAISVEPATVVIRTLDHEVFEKAGGNDYTSLRESLSEGVVVRGLTVIRNAHVHASVVIDPDIASVQGPFGLQGPWRIYPRWQPYDDLPHEIRHPAVERNTPRPMVVAAYRREVEGHLVVETLLDALRYFVVCDPTLVRWSSSSVVDGFPLPQLPNHGQYERQEPFAPRARDWEQSLRDYATAQTPASPRVITGGIEVDGGWLYFGHAAAYGRQPFVERALQIRADVAAGASYRFDDKTVLLQDDQLIAGSPGIVIDELLPGIADGEAQEALEHLELCDDDVYYYIRDRKG